MNILIAKANEQLIQSLCPSKKIEFNECTKNTVTFKLSRGQFDKLKKEILNRGYNPFALLTW